MNLDNIRLSKISQSEKDKYYLVYLYKVLRIVKFIVTKSIMVVARDWVERWVGSFSWG